MTIPAENTVTSLEENQKARHNRRSEGQRRSLNERTGRDENYYRERYENIEADVARGETYSNIGEKWGVTAQRIYQIRREGREKWGASATDPDGETTTTAPAPADNYLQLSRKAVGQVDSELGREDYPQAGEKAWGAVEAIIKALAEQRGWLHNHHDQIGDALRQLADEYGREDLKDYFTFATELRRNFSEDRLTEREVLRSIERARHLRRELEGFLTDPPPTVGFIPEEVRQKRRWKRLTGRPWDGG